MPRGMFSAAMRGWAEGTKRQVDEYCRVTATYTLDEIIALTARDTTWMVNHWKASLSGDVGPLDPMPPRDQVPMKPNGDDSRAACAPVFAEFGAGKKLLIANTATSHEDGYYPILTEYGGPRNPAHYTLTQVTAKMPEIAARALAAVKAAKS